MPTRPEKEEIKKRARELFMAVGIDLKPKYNMGDIIKALKIEYHYKTTRMTLHRWNAEGRWTEARDQAIAEAMGKVAADVEAANPTPPQASGPPGRDSTQHAEQAVRKAVASGKRVKEILTEHIADYLKGTRAVSLAALSHIADLLREHAAARAQLRAIIAEGPPTEESRAKVRALKDSLLSAGVLINIARLGNVAQGAQLNIIMEGDNNVNVGTVLMTWEGGFIGPQPPMPRTALPMPAGEEPAGLQPQQETE